MTEHENHNLSDIMKFAEPLWLLAGLAACALLWWRSVASTGDNAPRWPPSHRRTCSPSSPLRSRPAGGS